MRMTRLKMFGLSKMQMIRLSEVVVMGENVMFIELHYSYNGKPVLVGVKNICCISGGEEGTMIGFNGSDDNYVIVKESVEDIKAMFRYYANEGIME